MQSLRRPGPPRRRPCAAESPENRGEIRTEQLLLRVRAEGHLAAHAQDRRGVDVGGERPFPVHVSPLNFPKFSHFRCTLGPGGSPVAGHSKPSARYSLAVLFRRTRTTLGGRKCLAVVGEFVFESGTCKTLLHCSLNDTCAFFWEKFIPPLFCALVARSVNISCSRTSAESVPRRSHDLPRSS